MAPKPDENSDLEQNQLTLNEQKEKFKEILRSNGILDRVSEIMIKDAGLVGEGFASLTQIVTVKFENAEKKPLNLFVKVESDNPSHTEFINDLKAFEKEAMFLANYCRAANEMCRLKGFPDFMDFYPKCFYADKKMIVLENLVLEKGYTQANKEERQTFEHAKFALTTLAKHHALGHAMIEENGGPEKFFKRFPNLEFESFDTSFMINLIEGLCNNSVLSNKNILEKNDIPGAKEAAEKLKQYEGKTMSIILDGLRKQREENPFLVFGHGDYWNNNMMFLVDSPTKKIIHHVAIDFQITRYNTPALDLTYYFFTSLQPQVRRTHLLELLNLYKDTLNKTSEDFGHPTNLTLDQIFKDFRQKVGFGFWLGFISSVGPGMALFQDMDVSKIDVKDWPVIIDELLNKWIEENPEKGKETAEELVTLMSEYEQLKI